jgi:hypothetical protein
VYTEITRNAGLAERSGDAARESFLPWSEQEVAQAESRGAVAFVHQSAAHSVSMETLMHCNYSDKKQTLSERNLCNLIKSYGSFQKRASLTADTQQQPAHQPFSLPRGGLEETRPSR